MISKRYFQAGIRKEKIVKKVSKLPKHYRRSEPIVATVNEAQVKAIVESQAAAIILRHTNKIKELQRQIKFLDDSDAMKLIQNIGTIQAEIEKHQAIIKQWSK